MMRFLILATVLISSQLTPLSAAKEKKTTTVKAKLKDAGLFNWGDKKDEKKVHKGDVSKVAEKRAKKAQKDPLGLRTGIADIVEPLIPAVVNIAGIKEVKAPALGQLPQLPEGHPFGEIFKHFFEQQMQPQARQTSSLGSGFIVSEDGYIITNFHVVAESDKITVMLEDQNYPDLKKKLNGQKEIEAKIVGGDPRTDIALLKIDMKGLPFVKFGNSDKARVGDAIIAIGNPFGLGGTVTAGIISSKARDIAARSAKISADFVPGYFQIDAPINIGNSGGPMFNINGEVIGVNTAILSPSGGNVGIGFAIPSNLVKKVYKQLKEHGRTRRGWLGVRVQEVTPDIAESLGMKKARGALVGDINKDGPASKSDLKVGDVILEFNGTEVKESATLPRIVGESEVGTDVDATVLRDGKEVKFKIHVGEYEQAEEKGFIPSMRVKVDKQEKADALGLTVRPMTEGEKASRPKDMHGLVIDYVSPESEARAKGLRKGLVILKVSNKPVQTKDDFVKIIKQARKDKKKHVLFLIGVGDNVRFITLDLEEKKDEKKK